MFMKPALLIGVVLMAVAGAATGAPARESAARPDLARLVLRQRDLPGSTIIRQGYVKDPDYAGTYEREFDGGRFRSLRLSNTETDLSLAKTLADARLEITLARTMLGGRAGRQIFQAAFREGIAEEGGRVVSMRTLRTRNIRLGDGGAELAIAMRVTGGEMGKLVVPMQFSIMEFRVGRALATVYLTSQPGDTLPPGDVIELGKTFVARIAAGLDSSSS